MTSPINSNWTNIFRAGIPPLMVHEQNKSTLNIPAPLDPGAPQGDPNKFVLRQEVLLRNQKVLNRSKCFQICQNVCRDIAANSILNTQTAKDLCLFSSSNKDAGSYLGGSLSSQVQTEMGRSFFLSLLANPTNSAEILASRQTTVRALCQEPAYTVISQNLSKMKGAPEAELLGFWTKWLLPGFFASLYVRDFGEWNHYCNQNQHILAGQFFGAISQRVAAISLSALSVAAGALSAFHALGVIKSDAFSKFTAHFSNNLIARISGYVFPNYRITKLGIAWSAVYSASTIQGKCEWLNADLKVAKIVHEKSIVVAQHYRSMKEIYRCCLENSDLRNNLSYFNELDSFFNDPQLKPLFQALESRSLNSNTILFNPGAALVLCEFLQQKEIKTKFEKALVALGEIDAFMGAAHLIQKHSYCFPRYFEGPSPILEIDGFFHPQLDADRRILSDFKTSKHTVITGPNGRGKSTAARAIADVVVCAQTFGIVPAKKAEMSIFNIVRTSMPSHDDLSKDQSGFTGECERLDSIFQDLRKLEHGEKGIVILDELYKSTDSASALELSKRKFSEIANFSEVLFIALTNELKIAEAAVNNGFTPHRISESRVLEPGLHDGTLGGVNVAAKIGHVK